MGGADGQFGYTLQVYVHADSDIYELKDLKGKRVAHTSPTSNSGNMAPMALFPDQGVVPGEDYEIEFSGSHENSALGVVAGDYDAAPVASEVVDRMAERGLFDPEDVRIIFETDPFPTTSYGHAHNLHPDLVAKIKEAFLSYDFNGTPLGDEFQVDGFIEINYKDQWAQIRKIQEYNEVEYTFEGL
jgi:phosphonate transport system substrate-binding protein